jgi:hypothetical protein
MITRGYDKRNCPRIKTRKIRKMDGSGHMKRAKKTDKEGWKRDKMRDITGVYKVA